MANDNYEMIDRFLRNNLDDLDYAEYSKALDSILATQEGEAEPVVAYANPVILLPDEDGAEWEAKVQGVRDDVFSLPLYTTPPAVMPLAPSDAVTADLLAFVKKIANGEVQDHIFSSLEDEASSLWFRANALLSLAGKP